MRSLVAGLVAAIAFFAAGWLLLPGAGANLPLPQSDIPHSDPVPSWTVASRSAGVPLYVPDESGLGAPSLRVRGVPGDATRPVVATYAAGLEVIEAQHDVLPPPQPEQHISVAGASEAWTGEANGRHYVYVRRGPTLVLLSGAPDAALRRLAGTLRLVR
ncbi:MAG: hypothetical protein M3Y88_01890 [Chloroflexota bacterium]|nr:hypothetical protein [Chloroflexota bacterium]